jgi:bla regulator protein blaR1
MPTSGVTFQGSTLKFTVPGVGATFEGRLSADGRSITGTMTQGDRPLLLILTRANAETAWAIPEPPARATPMPADASPSFEVATIKPSRPEVQGKGFNVQGRTFRALNTTVTDVITFMYGVHTTQLVGGPSWMSSDKFDISGQPDLPGTPSLNQWRGMMQKLLADRFKLAFHRDRRELSVYAFTVAKSGPKMTKNDSDPNGLPALFFRGLGMLPARNANMAAAAGRRARSTGRRSNRTRRTI